MRIKEKMTCGECLWTVQPMGYSGVEGIHDQCRKSIIQNLRLKIYKKHIDGSVVSKVGLLHFKI